MIGRSAAAARGGSGIPLQFGDLWVGPDDTRHDEGFIDLRKTYGATPRHMNWAAYKAILANDRSFAREIFADLKGDADLQIWGTQEAFDGAKMFSEAK